MKSLVAEVVQAELNALGEGDWQALLSGHITHAMQKTVDVVPAFDELKKEPPNARKRQARRRSPR